MQEEANKKALDKKRKEEMESRKAKQGILAKIAGKLSMDLAIYLPIHVALNDERNLDCNSTFWNFLFRFYDFVQ